MFSVFSFNVDLAVEYVKNIYENILCPICDKPDLPRIRFSCGHSLCESCFNASVGCYICLTPPELSAYIKPQHDAVLSQQVKNVSQIVQAFEKVFNIDVYKRKRISEYLKIEKELFPKCIQAPHKYFNKRKSSSKSSYTDKENYHSKFLGEDISPVKNNKMENSVNYVQNWLNKNDTNRKRKPLADINVDNADIKRKSGIWNSKVNSLLNIKSYEKKQKRHRKILSHKTTSLVECQSTLNKFLTHDKLKKSFKDVSIKKSNESCTSEVTEIDKAQEKDESGIVIDDNNCIMIEDSQLSVDYDKSLVNTIVDKDKNALLQVEEAFKNQEDSIILNRTPCYKEKIQQTKEDVTNNEFCQQYKVPYYKMGYLQETCFLCSEDMCVQNVTKYKSKGQFNNTCVTIDGNSFTATIRVFNNIENINQFNKKTSLPVQTDIVDINNFSINCEKELANNNLRNNDVFSKPVLVTKSVDIKSQELFMSEEVPDNIFNDLNIELDKRKNVIIEDSDSSEDMAEARVLEVTADIHRSFEEFDYDILTNVDNIEDHMHRPRRRPRGHTPDSSNSSDKENFDPNRSKKSKTPKKTCYKK